MIENKIRERVLEIFPSLQSEDLDLLLENIGTENLHYSRYSKDEVLITPDSQENKVFLILEGFVYVSVVDTKGEEAVFLIGSSGEIAGSRGAMFKDTDKSYYVKVLKGTELLVIESSFLFEKLMNQSSLAAWLLQMIQRMFGKILKRTETLLTLTAKERYEKLVEEYPQYVQNFPNKHIATFLGITPNSLSRIRARAFKK